MAGGRRRVWRMAGLALLLLGGGAVLAMWLGVRAWGLPPGTLHSDARVEIVRATDTVDFRPRPDDRARTGLIFFPGALVAPEAYAPMARRLAEQGHHVVIIRLPFRLAPTHTYHRMVFETARDTLTAPPRPWVIAGHGRGGKLAAEFVAEHPSAVAGLALIGTSHPRKHDLSALPACVPVIRILGTRDGVAPPAEAAQYRHNVPGHTAYTEIDGGNHSQFAYYRFQMFDRRATIDRERQQHQLLAALLTVLRPGGRPGRCQAT